MMGRSSPGGQDGITRLEDIVELDRRYATDWRRVIRVRAGDSEAGAARRAAGLAGALVGVGTGTCGVVVPEPTT